MSISQSANMLVCLSCPVLSVCLSARPSVCLSVCLSVPHIRRFCRHYEGEIVFTYCAWEQDDEPLSAYRDRRFWDPQFAVDNDQHDLLKQNYGRCDQNGTLNADVDMLAVGSTSLFRILPGGGHQKRKGNATTLAELIAALGDQYTAMELMCWWWHAQQITGRQPHPV